MFKKISAFILALIVCLSSASVLAEREQADTPPTGIASATPYTSDLFYEDGEPSDSLVHYMTVDYFYVQSTAVGKVKVYVKLTTEDTMEKLGFSKLIIQHWNGSSWDDVVQITDQYSLNTTQFTYSYTASNLNSGDYYRATAYFVARKTWLLIEKKTVSTSYITCL
mgnify:CR=1 FL=1